MADTYVDDVMSMSNLIAHANIKALYTTKAPVAKMYRKVASEVTVVMGDYVAENT